MSECIELNKAFSKKKDLTQKKLLGKIYIFYNL